MLNHHGLPTIRARSAKFHVSHTRTASSRRTRLGPEFHADVSFWRLMVAGGVGSPAGRFFAPSYRSYMQPPAFTLWSDVSGDSMGGYILGPETGSGAWWHLDFDDEVLGSAGVELC